MMRVRWNCGRCGYLALSSPHEDLEDDSGTVIHKCPECGEQWWLDEDTYARLHPAALDNGGGDAE